jgi:hypothetical protein
VKQNRAKTIWSLVLIIPVFNADQSRKPKALSGLSGSPHVYVNLANLSLEPAKFVSGASKQM